MSSTTTAIMLEAAARTPGRASPKAGKYAGEPPATELSTETAWARSCTDSSEGAGEADEGLGHTPRLTIPEPLPEPSLEDSIQLFRSAIMEPYETVFADPPSPERSRRWTDVGDDAAEDAHLMIRNLDTGEVRRLGDSALSLSFVGQAPPLELPSERRPWRSWWQEKRQRDERLWRATAAGDLEGVYAAISPPEDGGAPGNVNFKALHGRTALHVAASTGNLPCLEALLDAGADTSATTDSGYTALHVASDHGHARAVKLLLDWGSDPFQVAEDGSLPLHLAAWTGHKEVVTELLESVGPRQLVVRNNCGQVPEEVSMDITTASAFRQYSSSTFGDDGASITEVASPRLSASLFRTEASSGGSSLSPSKDRYSGRTTFQGTVLLHNARADVVRRLLHRTNYPTSDAGDSGTEPMSPVRSLSPAKVRRPFVRVRQDRQEPEQAGPDSFVLVKLLGRGSFGEVFQVQHRRTGQHYAMKILQKRQVFSRNLLRYAMTERNVLSYVRHPYITSLYYAFQTPSLLVMVLKFAPNGNLQHLLDRERRLQEPLARLYTAELVLALGHLHERRIVFRDLKPENVVLSEECHCMLTDFGLSKEGVMGLHGTRSFCGSVAFLAPEILLQRGHGHTVDIYGIGVLLYDMLTGLPPFHHPDRDTLYTNIKYARLRIPPYVPSAAAALIQAVMDREPAKRLGAGHTSELHSHPFFEPIDFAALFRREIPVPACTSFPINGNGTTSHSSKPHSPWLRHHVPAAPVTGWEYSTTAR